MHVPDSYYPTTSPLAVKFSQKLFTAKQLMRRWPKITTYRLLTEYIDSSCDKTNPKNLSKKTEFLDFPVAYYHLGTGYDLYDKKIEYCKRCESDDSTGKKYFKPYKISCDGSKNIFSVGRVMFKLSDIKEYEAKYPHIKEKPDKISKQIVNIDISEISGKETNFVFSHLKSKNIAPQFIAYVLYNYCKLKNKTEIGRFFREKHESDSTCAKHAKKLLEEAEQFKIIME